MIWLELTSPLEENLTKKHFETMDKYNKVAIDLREGKHHGVKWTGVPLCVEVVQEEQSMVNPGTGCVNVSASANVQSAGWRRGSKTMQ